MPSKDKNEDDDEKEVARAQLIEEGGEEQKATQSSNFAARISRRGQESDDEEKPNRHKDEDRTGSFGEEFVATSGVASKTKTDEGFIEEENVQGVLQDHQHERSSGGGISSKSSTNKFFPEMNGNSLMGPELVMGDVEEVAGPRSRFAVSSASAQNEDANDDASERIQADANKKFRTKDVSDTLLFSGTHGTHTERRKEDSEIGAISRRMRRARLEARQVERESEVAAAAADLEASANADTSEATVANVAGPYGIPTELPMPPPRALLSAPRNETDDEQHNQFQHLPDAPVRVVSTATDARVLEDPSAPIATVIGVDDVDDDIEARPASPTINIHRRPSQNNNVPKPTSFIVQCPKRTFKFNILFVLGFVFALVLLAVILVLSLRKEEYAPIPSPTSSPIPQQPSLLPTTAPSLRIFHAPSFVPSLAPTVEIEPLKQLIQSASPNPRLLDRMFSNQREALVWLYDSLANDDVNNTARIMLESYEPRKLIQRHAIAVFYMYTQVGNELHWRNQEGWMQKDVDECLWFGVTCDDNGTIIELELPRNSLRGNLPNEIGLFHGLRSLILSNNAIKGTLPDTITTLPILENFVMQNNNLRGKLTSKIGKLTTLKVLNLGDNNELGGTIPATFGNLQNLEKLILFGNQHTGRLPQSLWRLTNLIEMILDSNRLDGTVPSSLGSLPHLTVLKLSANQFSRTIPSLIGNLTSLTDLFLDYNDLTGTLPSDLGNMMSLERLDLSKNRLNGTLPSELGRIQSLETFEIFSNTIKGKLPTTFGNWERFVCLNVETNLMTGSIPDSLGNSPKLKKMDLSNNSFTGTMPQSICDARLSKLDADCLNPSREVTCFCCTQCKNDFISASNTGKTQCN